jgi:hypothetical protein
MNGARVVTEFSYREFVVAGLFTLSEVKGRPARRAIKLLAP